MFAFVSYLQIKIEWSFTNVTVNPSQPGRDAKGAALALFTARLHRPDVTTHKAVLQAIIYQLDKAIER